MKQYNAKQIDLAACAHADRQTNKRNHIYFEKYTLFHGSIEHILNVNLCPLILNQYLLILFMFYKLGVSTNTSSKPQPVSVDVGQEIQSTFSKYHNLVKRSSGRSKFRLNFGHASTTPGSNFNQTSTCQAELWSNILQ